MNMQANNARIALLSDSIRAHETAIDNMKAERQKLILKRDYYPRLQTFYRELQAWIDSGMLNTEIFTKHAGICLNASRYFTNDQAIDALILQFKEAGLHTILPFAEDHDQYWLELNSGTLYTNPKRLAWIKSHAEEI